MVDMHANRKIYEWMNEFMVGRHRKTQYTRINPSIVFARTGDSGSIILSSNVPLVQVSPYLVLVWTFSNIRATERIYNDLIVHRHFPETEQKLTFCIFIFFLSLSLLYFFLSLPLLSPLLLLSLNFFFELSCRHYNTVPLNIPVSISWE